MSKGTLILKTKIDLFCNLPGLVELRNQNMLIEMRSTMVKDSLTNESTCSDMYLR